MLQDVVIGLFYTSGTAQDVAHRLRFEGVPEPDIEVRQLRASDPLPPTMATSAAGYRSDAFWGGIILKKFGERIGDGETAVCVHSQSADETRIAVGTMRQYQPIGIELVTPAEEADFLREAQATPASAAPPRR
ncbi:MAG TPA: hypothetical protein VFA22_01650 [Stellaceae bacterium]|nr:hypothetical protein [Stellaceae bacterium]